MNWSTVPDLTSRKSLLIAALIVAAVSALAVGMASLDAFRHGVGDTDDAVRLVLVRELLAGHGWYHPEIARLQAPWGALMHWSRLLDGAIAALDLVFRIVLSPAQAELAARAVWPLLWLFPAALSALAIARRLGGSVALLATAIFTPTSLAALEQFRLGRVDHHNVQIVMVLTAAAAAIAGRDRPRAGLIAGLAGAFGLAVGSEGLVFHALIGAWFAFGLLRDEAETQAARRYGLALALGALGFFLIQTPPRLWTISVCDTIGANLVVALLIAGLGLAGTSSLGRTRAVRFALAGVTGVAALGAYLAMNPNCLHGPMGGVQPPVSDYINRVVEMASFSRAWLTQGPTSAALISGPALALVASPFLLARRQRWRDPAWLLLVALLGAGTVLTLLHVRMHAYPNWFALPVLGCAVADLAPLWRRLLTPTVLFTVLICPTNVALAAMAIAAPLSGPARKAPDRPAGLDACFQAAAYADFARRAPGLVLSELDLGPYVLAYTPHAAMAGPYHRFRRGIGDSIRAFSLPPEAAQYYVRSLGVGYVVDCPGHADQFDRVQTGPRGLLAALDQGRAPSWLEPLSAPADGLQVYRVQPAIAAKAPHSD